MSKSSRDIKGQYFDYVEDIAGEGGKFFKIGDNGEAVLVAAYKDVPESGCLTAFSFGLSDAVHPEWVESRPELVISVNSDDYAWALAMGEIIKNGRGKSLFSYGSILNFGTPISEESSMSAFFVFVCNVLEEDDLKIQLTDRVVNLSQIYPIYQAEIPLIKKIGVEKFFTGFDIDFFNVRRDVMSLV